MRKKTPQEKKLLSYARDRRNCYGESPHAARKAIPLNKSLRNRANRRYQDQQLTGVGVNPDEEWADEIESRVRHRAPKRWDKVPDAPLLEVVKRKRERRRKLQASGGRRAKGKKKEES